MFFEFDSVETPEQGDKGRATDDGGSEKNSTTTSSSNDNIAPLAFSTPMSTLRNRRYSFHSERPLQSFVLDKKMPNCDLALIAKKKLEQVEELDQDDSDIKIVKNGSKHSSSDLRREVLLNSMQRSLSMSTEDLLFASNSSMSSSSLNDTPNDSNRFPLTCSTEEFSTDSSLVTSSSISSSQFYKPMENQMPGSSKITFTSTNSLAGTRLLGDAPRRSFNPYSGLNRTALTTTSSSASPLKKRCHPSPSKYSTSSCSTSPSSSPHSHKEGSYSGTSISSTCGTFSPPPDPTHKKFKGNPPLPSTQATQTVDHFGDGGAPIQPATSSSQDDTSKKHSNVELGQLAQDFDRLKTPFQ